MWRRHLFISIIVYILVLLQTSFFYTDDWNGKINLILLLLMGILFVYSFNYALIWTIICGYLLDLYSNLGFGLYLLCFLATILLIRYLLKNIVYFRYQWAIFLLIFIGVFFFNSLMPLLSYIIYRINFDYNYLPFSIINIAYQLAVDYIVILLVLYSQKFFKRYLLIYDKK